MAKTRIMDLCKQKGITQQELADKLGLYRTSLSIAISNDTLSVERLSIIADILGVEIVDLFPPKDESNFTAMVNYNGKLMQFDSVPDLKKFLKGIE